MDDAQRNGLRTKQVHFVLVQAFVGAELELALAVIEIDVGHRVTHVFAPVAYFDPLSLHK